MVKLIKLRQVHELIQKPCMCPNNSSKHNIINRVLLYVNNKLDRDDFMTIVLYVFTQAHTSSLPQGHCIRYTLTELCARE